MLRFLGPVYYILAALCVILALTQGNRYDGGWTLWFGLASALSLSFFGAICFAADDIRSLLVRIADGHTPNDERIATPEEGAGRDRICTFCNREVPKGSPCSTIDAETLRQRAPLISNGICRAELTVRGYLDEQKSEPG